MRNLNRLFLTSTFIVAASFVAGCGSSSGTTTTTTVNTAIAGLALDASFTTLYVANADSHVVQTLDPTQVNPVVVILAGSAGNAGTADGTTTASAGRFNEPVGITRFLGGAGTDLYVADTFNHGVRKLSNAGVISNVAGNLGVPGSFDNAGSSASFNYPRGITNDGINLYVADTGNHTIRKVTTGGMVTTLAGYPGVSGNADGTGSNVRFNSPYGIISNGTDLYVSDAGSNLIRKVTTGGVVSLFAGSSTTAGHADGDALTVATFNAPAGVATDGTNVFVADSGNHTIRMIVIGTGAVSTIAGLANNAGSTDGTDGASARFNTPTGLILDTTGHFLYVSDQNFKKVRKIVLGGVTPTAATITVSTLNASF